MSDTQDDIALLRAQNAELQRKLAEARKALEKYGRHQHGCPEGPMPAFIGPCTCGLSAALSGETKGGDEPMPTHDLTKPSPLQSPGVDNANHAGATCPKCGQELSLGWCFRCNHQWPDSELAKLRGIEPQPPADTPELLTVEIWERLCPKLNDGPADYAPLARELCHLAEDLQRQRDEGQRSHAATLVELEQVHGFNKSLAQDRDNAMAQASATRTQLEVVKKENDRLKKRLSQEHPTLVSELEAAITKAENNLDAARKRIAELKAFEPRINSWLSNSTATEKETYALLLEIRNAIAA